ncbi:MAG: hypothetical protein MI749_01350 [Desulfovibrionales bacterium]|nr:hypothetical protein [Desulfovibrionales bacterium]
MFSKVIVPYVAPTAFFSVVKPEKIDVRILLGAACMLAFIPLCKMGLGNLLGTFLHAYVEEYAVVAAFSLWYKPASVLQQQVAMIPIYMLVLIVYGGVLHCLLWMAQGVSASYPATLRCLCFAIPCMLLAVIPYSGIVAAALYGAMFLGYSLKATHGASWRSVLPVAAVNVPVLLLASRILFP